MAENPTSESPIQWHSNNIPYLDSFAGRDDAFVFTREDYDSRLKTWIEPKDLNKDRCYLAKGMLFASKKALQRAVKIYCFKDMREFKVDQSTSKIWRLVCRRRFDSDDEYDGGEIDCGDSGGYGGGEIGGRKFGGGGYGCGEIGGGGGGGYGGSSEMGWGDE
ncbi:glycine-rich RNA-binding protein blt801-like [Lycium ferocissimum]|uniref:glycine-rich RNA-binding protein blt801-like n=1 Tax=Lycium ferocissimum TaxID=112874 RepID=UPI00281644FE|nr:glycine-rich RNA-binding protein blt801-like [Lycium ferocissimum]